MSRLEVDKLQVAYGRVRAVRGVSFSVGEREVVALLGANGAGKSSTLKAIMGLVAVDGGRVLLDGQSIEGSRPYEVVRRGIGFSPEGRRVFAANSVHENLMAGAHTLPRQIAKERLDQVYDYFPRLKERSRQLAGSLSGGEQQTLAIGRALMSLPRILLLDEPTLGLAPVMVERIGEMVRKIQEAERIAVLIAEQNSAWALELAHRGIVLEVGNIKLEGPAVAMRHDDYVRRAYLGV
jgi:branched-chain amino acid transport system ATP-binding protein